MPIPFPKQRALTEQQLHKAFLATVLVNGVIAVLDIAAGFFFAFLPAVTAVLESAVRQGGALATLAGFVQDMSGRVQSIGAFYFFSHGAVKFFLVWGLWKNKLWAYPVAVIFLGGFSLYQLYELLHQYSVIILAFMLFNTVVIALVIQEYRTVVARMKLTSNAARS